jgi:DNA-binding NtrC family response regulator
MRIVVVGLEEGDALAARLATACPAGRVVRATAAEAPAAAEHADLVVLSPACVASDAVVTTIRAVRRANGAVPVLAVGDDDRAALAVALLKAGASDYAVADADDLGDVVRGLVAPRTSPATPDLPVPGLVGPSRAMAEVRALVRVAAGTEAHVLLEGETGTGKEVVARAVHTLGQRGSVRAGQKPPCPNRSPRASSSPRARRVHRRRAGSGQVRFGSPKAAPSS